MGNKIERMWKETMTSHEKNKAKQVAKYDYLQKDSKPVQTRKAFEHKPYACYTVDDSLRKMGFCSHINMQKI